MISAHRTFIRCSRRRVYAAATSPSAISLLVLATIVMFASLSLAVDAAIPTVTRTNAAGGGTYAVADVFQANISVNADVSSGWPSTTSAFASLSESATELIATSLSLAVSQVSAFYIQSGTSVATLQIRVVSTSIGASSNVYAQLMAWTSSSAGSTALLSSLTSAARTALSAPGLADLSYRTGRTTMPCRSQQAYNYLPVCAPASTYQATAEVQSTVLHVNTTSGSSSVQSAICAVITSTTASLSTPITDCTPYLSVATSSSAANAYVIATITGLANSLEIALMFVNNVRNGAASMTASKILLAGASTTTTTATSSGVLSKATDSPAVLYASNENAPYGDSPFLHPECTAIYGLWGVALVAAPFIALIVFWFVYHRGRHNSKKRERKRIQADEMENMRAMGAPGGADAVNMGGYPGMWGQDQQQYATGEEGGAGSYMYDPATGTYYLVGDDGAAQAQTDGADEYYDSAAYPAQQQVGGEDGYYQEGDGGAGEVEVAGDGDQWVDEQAYDQQQVGEDGGGYVEEGGAYDDNAAGGVYDENAGGEQQVVMGEDGNYYYVNDINNGAGQA